MSVTDFSQVRKGDTVRIELDGTVEEVGMHGRWTTVSLAVGDDHVDAKVWFDDESVAPGIRILSTNYRPGDFAVIAPHGSPKVQAMFVNCGTPSCPDRAWVGVNGRFYRNLNADQVELVRRVDVEGGV